MVAEGLAMRPGPRPRLDDGLLALLRDAIKSGRVVAFDYRAEVTGQVNRRHVQPYGIIRGNRASLVGHTERGSDLHLWRLARTSVAICTHVARMPLKWYLVKFLDSTTERSYHETIVASRQPRPGSTCGIRRSKIAAPCPPSHICVTAPRGINVQGGHLVQKKSHRYATPLPNRLYSRRGRMSVGHRFPYFRDRASLTSSNCRTCYRCGAISTPTQWRSPSRQSSRPMGQDFHDPRHAI